MRVFVTPSAATRTRACMDLTHPDPEPAPPDPGAPPAHRQETRRAAKARQILEAAAGLFFEHGFGATSMDAVAARAGVSKRTVYAHFTCKVDLFVAVVDQFRRTHGIPDSGEPRLDDPYGSLCAIGMAFLNMLLAPQALRAMRVLAAEGETFPDLADGFWHAGPVACTQDVAGYLRRLSAAGVVRVDDPDLAARQFLGLIKGPVFFDALLGLQPPPPPARVEAVVRAGVRLFLAGLGWQSPQASATGQAGRE